MNNKFFQNSKHEDDSVIFELILEETLRDFDYNIDDVPDEAIIEQIAYNSSLYGYVLNELTFGDWIRQAGKVQIGKEGKALIAGKDSYALDAAKVMLNYGVRPGAGMAVDATKAGLTGLGRWATKEGTGRGKFLDNIKKGITTVVKSYKQNIPGRPQQTQQTQQSTVNRVPGRTSIVVR